MASSSPPPSIGEKKHWWFRNRKIVEKYVKDARFLIATQEQNEIASALNLLDAALALSPRYEPALELKAKSLLCLRRFKDVANMLQDYIPSLKLSSDDSSSSTSSLSSDGSTSQPLSKEQVKLLSSSGGNSPETNSPVSSSSSSFKCFSVSDLKKKVMAGLCKNCDKEGQWRYLVLGQACCHLGLMEDAMLLLQTGKRLATDAFRRESICWSDDSFSLSSLPISAETSNQPATPPRTESESISHLLGHVKLLIRRKTAAIAALDAGLHTEAIRHFSKIVDSRRGAPQGFLAECYVNRASAFKFVGRIAESIADCNRTLALDPSCIEALSIRASLFETIRCLPDSLHDLEHLKLLYSSILRERKQSGPAWKRQTVRYREIPGKLCSLTAKIQELKQRVASGEIGGNVDYYALIGLRRGCSRSELQRAHLLLTIKHKPDKSICFMDRCEFADESDVDSIRDRAKLSTLLLFRLIQKGYTFLMKSIMEEEAVEKQRMKTAAALQAASVQIQQTQQTQNLKTELEKKIIVQTTSSLNKLSPPPECSSSKRTDSKTSTAAQSSSVFQGVFCRDLATVGNLLSQAGFNRPITVKYEALSC
ncbi:uncharacterized protein LOC124938856 [Impatiens glandulifera]|uniref:uncharacterized protein LOC124938856 n=1 Tax=Impatiens glandulifera TaxID=253017 RepID=UPI001FB10508|nr:uncharacterized protein LOC124938856 [Impatiens glandulifera]